MVFLVSSASLRHGAIDRCDLAQPSNRCEDPACRPTEFPRTFGLSEGRSDSSVRVDMNQWYPLENPPFFAVAPGSV